MNNKRCLTSIVLAFFIMTLFVLPIHAAPPDARPVGLELEMPSNYETTMYKPGDTINVKIKATGKFCMAEVRFTFDQNVFSYVSKSATLSESFGEGVAKPDYIIFNRTSDSETGNLASTVIASVNLTVKASITAGTPSFSAKFDFLNYLGDYEVPYPQIVDGEPFPGDEDNPPNVIDGGAPDLTAATGITVVARPSNAAPVVSAVELAATPSSAIWSASIKATPTFTDADDGTTGATFAYTWKRDGVAITGAPTTDTYPTTKEDIGSVITASVVVTDKFGAASAPFTSASGITVAHDPAQKPVISIASSTLNVPQTGGTLSAASLTPAPVITESSNFTATNKGTVTPSTDIKFYSDAARTTVITSVSQQDVIDGKTIYVTATYTDKFGVVSDNTAAVAKNQYVLVAGPIAPKIDPAPELGSTNEYMVDKTVYAQYAPSAFSDPNTGEIDATTYQWFADGVEIAGASGTCNAGKAEFKITAAQRDKVLSVKFYPKSSKDGSIVVDDPAAPAITLTGEKVAINPGLVPTVTVSNIVAEPGKPITSDPIKVTDPNGLTEDNYAVAEITGYNVKLPGVDDPIFVPAGANLPENDEDGNPIDYTGATVTPVVNLSRDGVTSVTPSTVTGTGTDGTPAEVITDPEVTLTESEGLRVDSTVYGKANSAIKNPDYQWYRIDSKDKQTKIGGATEVNYKATAADIGYKLRLVATGDGGVTANATTTGIITGIAPSAEDKNVFNKSFKTGANILAKDYYKFVPGHVGLKEGSSQIRWYSSSSDVDPVDADFAGTTPRASYLIPVSDSGRYLWMQVTPVDEKGQVGEPIIIGPTAKITKSDSTGGGGYSSGSSVSIGGVIGEPTDAARKFGDLAGYDWANGAINGMALAGIINGVTPTTYEPGRAITRAEFAKIVTMMTGGLDMVADKVFTDSDEHWAKEYIATANKRGLVQGYPDGSFGCDMPISRQDISVIIDRTAAYLNTPIPVVVESPSFNDDNSISDYAFDSVKKLQKGEILKGYEDGSFQPLKNANRAETAVIIFRTFPTRFTY